MNTAPTILHADLDAFYASVEQRDRPELRRRPLAVGTGVVLAASYEARSRGVYTTMTAARARAACPDLVMVPPRMDTYAEASRRVYEIFRETVPAVEALSIDEAFLETRGLERVKGTSAEIAKALRREVRNRVGLAISVGVARTKFLAKIASGEAKPDGLLVIGVGEELDFLHPLPVRRVWGVGRVTAEKLNGLGIHTIGDLARSSPARLAGVVGAGAAHRLIDLAHNRDPREVATRQRRRSIGAQAAFPAGSRNHTEIESLLASLTDRVCNRLRAGGRSCRTVALNLRFGDYSRATRSRTLPAPTDHTGIVLASARALLAEIRTECETKGLTLVGVGLGNLESAGSVQLELPLNDSASPAARERTPAFTGRNSAALDEAVDQVRRRFGSDSIRRASGIEAEPEIAAPTLPD